VKLPDFNYWKALAGFVAAGLVAYLGCQDGGVTGQEWGQVLLAALGGSGLVLVSPKNVKAAKGEGGQADVGLILLCLTFVGVVLLLFRVKFG
jgi:hypothetical protein